jgi:hypothetical protein
MRQTYEAAYADATGDSPPLGSFEDEPDWMAESANLVEFLRAGPYRPFAEERRRVAAAEATGARQHEALVRWAVTAGRSNRSVLDQVGSVVREESPTSDRGGAGAEPGDPARAGRAAGRAGVTPGQVAPRPHVE